jgi:peroxiredoxin
MAKIIFGGNPAQTVGNLPEIGSKAPNFKLTSGDLSEISLSNFIGKVIEKNNPKIKLLNKILTKTQFVDKICNSV